MAVNMREASLTLWCAALGVLFLSADPMSAQPVQSTLQQRIEAAARAALNSPRLKGLTEQQRIGRVEFVAGNTLVLLSHESGNPVSYDESWEGRHENPARFPFTRDIDCGGHSRLPERSGVAALPCALSSVCPNSPQVLAGRGLSRIRARPERRGCLARPSLVAVCHRRLYFQRLAVAQTDAQAARTVTRPTASKFAHDEPARNRRDGTVRNPVCRRAGLRSPSRNSTRECFRSKRTLAIRPRRAGTSWSPTTAS
jgi:hypothetical protein